MASRYKKPLRDARIRREYLRGRAKRKIRKATESPVTRRAVQLNLNDANDDVKRLEAGESMTDRSLNRIKRSNASVVRRK